MASEFAPQYSAVCCITDTLGQGSGVLISPDCVLTAAHVVSNSAAIVDASSVKVAFGYSNGVAADGTYLVSAISSYDVSIKTATDSEFDFAVLHLSRPVSDISYMSLSPNFGGGSATVSGYPATALGGQVDSTQIVADVPGQLLIQFATLGAGSSGGPVWTGSVGDGRVIGVISSASVNLPTTGFAGLISGSIAQQIMDWVSVYDAPLLTQTAAALSAQLQPADNPASVSTESVYRFMNTATGAHFYTASASEADAVRASGVFVAESNSFREVALDSNDPSACPVYRFFDTHDGGHMLTANPTERDSLLATRPDLIFEGAAMEEHASPRAGDQAVYRFFDKVDGGHFFTADGAELKAAMSNNSLIYEGIAFYAPTT